MLIAGMTGMGQLGLRESLRSSDLYTEQVDTACVVDRVVEAPPDAIVLDLDAVGTSALTAELTRKFPSVTVVACSMLEPRMRVFPASDRSEPYDAPLTPAALTAALTSED